MFTTSLINFLIKNKKSVWSAILILTIFFAYQCTKIQVDNDSFKAIPPNLQAKLDYEELKEEFPAPYTVLFLAEFQQGTLNEKVDSLRSWSEWFTSLQGVASVSGLNTIQIPVRRGLFGMSGEFLIPLDKTLEEQQLRERIAENKDLIELFISEDESIFVLILGMEENVDRTILMDQVLNFSQQLDSQPHLNTYITSEAGVSYFIDRSMRRDFTILLPICFLIIALLLYRIFRRVRYVTAALSVNIVALIWTFGILSLSGVTFSIITAIIPVILFPIGVANAIHLLRTFSIHKTQGMDTDEALISTYKELLTPCLLTSLTTSVGFFSFAISDISWTRHFGIFTGIAVLFAFLFNTTILPLFLIGDTRPVAYKTQSAEESALKRFWLVFGNFSFSSRWRYAIIVPYLIFLIFGIVRVNVETNPMNMLPESSFLRQSDAFIANRFGGTRFFSVVLTSPDKIDNKERWVEVQEIKEYIAQQPEVGNVISVLPLLNKMSMLTSKEPLSNAAITLVSGSGSLFGSNYQNLINTWLSEDRTKTRFNITVRNTPGLQPLAVAEDIENFVTENFQQWDVLVSGATILNESMAAVLIDTQIASLFFTFIPILLCVTLLFRSLRAGLFAIFPIVLSTGFVYALMGAMGVNINLVTVVTMNTCIGIGIDYSIHFLSGFLFQRKDKEREEALIATLKRKGTPIAFNTMIVGLGFLILSFSSFPPVRDFGVLVFASMFISALFSILFITILISVFGINYRTNK